MKTYTQDELKKIYTARKEKLLAYMTEHGITAPVRAALLNCTNAIFPYFFSKNKIMGLELRAVTTPSLTGAFDASSRRKPVSVSL